MDLLVLIGVVVVGALAFGIARAVWRHNEAGKVRASITSRHKVRPLHVSTSDRSSVAVDFAQGRVVLGSGGYDRVYAFAQIVAVELVEDGVAVSRTNRGSQAVGIALGAVALGSTGAIIGGLSASRTTQQRLKRVALNITVQDQGKPLHVVTFLAAGDRGAEPATATAARQQAENVRAQLLNAMSQAGSHPARVVVATAAVGAAALSAPASVLVGKGACKLILLTIGRNKDSVEKVIAREVPEYSYERRSHLMFLNATPAVLMTNVSEARAHHVHGALAGAGAQARVGRVGFP